jgi:hypothetical protein
VKVECWNFPQEGWRSEVDAEGGLGRLEALLGSVAITGSASVKDLEADVPRLNA